MSDPDDLYTLRNLFWLGNFQVILFKNTENIFIDPSLWNPARNQRGINTK